MKNTLHRMVMVVWLTFAGVLRNALDTRSAMDTMWFDWLAVLEALMMSAVATMCWRISIS